MEQLLDFLKSFNASTLIGIGLIMWYFSRHIENKIDAIVKRSDESFAAQTARSNKLSDRADRLYEMFIELLNKQR
jgi:hypothetical protein